MTLGGLAFAALVWGSLAAVLLTFAYLLRVVGRELRGAEDSSGAGPEVER